MIQPLYIVDGTRTPFCKAGTDLAGESAVDLGTHAFQHVLAKTGINPARIDQVFIGCVGQPVDAANIARIIALRAGIPAHVPAMTVHRNCASGLEALTQAHQASADGQGEIFLIGATESMSQYPLLFPRQTAGKFNKIARARTPVSKLKSLSAFRLDDFTPKVALKLGLTDPICNLNMGQTAETLAREFKINRRSQDLYALQSHQRAISSRGRLREETLTLYPNSGGSNPKFIENDNGPREKQSEEALNKLNPVFDRDYGTVTAGNASQISDGAAALLVMSGKACDRLGFEPLGRLVDYAYTGCDPRRMGLGPAHAIHALEQKTGRGLDNADLIEINEAFAVQVLAVTRACSSKSFCQRKLKRKHPLGEIPSDKLNVNGGAIALGHPVGATGTRLVLTTLKELQRRKSKHALVSLCIGGGQGAAVWLEAA